MCCTKVKIDILKILKIYFTSCRVPLTKDQQIMEPDWEIYLRDTARMIGEQQTPQR
jgi:hypothetical protein